MYRLFIILLILLGVSIIVILLTRKSKYDSPNIIALRNSVQDSLKENLRRKSLLRAPTTLLGAPTLTMTDINRQNFLYFKNLIDKRLNTIKSAPKGIQNFHAKNMPFLNTVIATHITNYKLARPQNSLTSSVGDVPESKCSQMVEFIEIYNGMKHATVVLSTLIPIMASLVVALNVEDGLDEVIVPIEIMSLFSKEAAKELIEGVAIFFIEIFKDIFNSIITNLYAGSPDILRAMSDVALTITNLSVWVAEFLIDPFQTGITLTVDLIGVIGCLASKSPDIRTCALDVISLGSIDDICAIFDINTMDVCVSGFDHGDCSQYTNPTDKTRVPLQYCTSQGSTDETTKCLAASQGDSCTNACKFFGGRNSCGTCNKNGVCICNSRQYSPAPVVNPQVDGKDVYGYKCLPNKTCGPITDLSDPALGTQTTPGTYFAHDANCAGMCDLTGKTVQLIGGNGDVSPPMNFCNLSKLPNSCADLDHNINFNGGKSWNGSCIWQGLTNISPGMNIIPYGIAGGSWLPEQYNCTPFMNWPKSITQQANLANFYGSPVPAVASKTGISFKGSEGGACSGKFTTTTMNPNACG